MKNKGSVLIARSKLENQNLSQILIKEGFDVIAIDMLEYENLPFNIDNINQYDYIILTSKYACQIMPQYEMNKKFLVVGDESANIIKRKNQNAEVKYFNSVKEIITYISNIDKSKIIYLSGTYISETIKDVSRIIIYNIQYKEKLEADLLKKIACSNINYVMVFSNINFQKILHIFKTHDIINSINSSLFVCISRRVAEKVSLVFDKLVFTENPSQIEMIKLMNNYDRTQ